MRGFHLKLPKAQHKKISQTRNSFELFSKVQVKIKLNKFTEYLSRPRILEIHVKTDKIILGQNNIWEIK
jgi:hypothetical protein